jgi:hypothetical protein
MALRCRSGRSAARLCRRLIHISPLHCCPPSAPASTAHQQYGQTAVLFHLAMKWGVDVDSPDHDGRTPLHWAAYKGFADCIRLLLVLDCRYSLPDKEGCTPLHWAAIKGNGEACTVLVQVGPWAGWGGTGLQYGRQGA